MLKDKNQNLFREERLVWMTPPEGPSTEPVQADAAVQAVENKESVEYKEKITAKNIDEIAKRVKDLNFQNPVDIKTLPGQAPVLQFKAALSKALDGYTPKLNVKNLDQFLLNGLMEQLGAADTEISKMKPNENQALSKFLQKHNVAKFTIEDGFWRFIDKNGKTVKADYQLDGVGNAPTEKAVLGSAVQKAKEADAAAKKEAEAQAKTEAERTDAKKLEGVKSALSVPLAPSMTIDDLLIPLEQTVLGEDGKPKITAQEMRETLTTYLANSGEADPDKNFAAFMNTLRSQGYTECHIERGRFVFTKNNASPSSNPLNVSDGAVQDVMYAHPKLATERKAEAQQEATEKAKNAEPITTPFDTAEQEAVKIITGKENPDERDVNNANVDARYLLAIQGILNYREGGVPVDVKIPFNDRNPMDCKYYMAKDGSYVLSWSNGKGFHRYMPTVKGAPGLQEARRYFVANLNNGRVFQEVQRSNVNKRSSFEQWGMEVDKGPTAIENGGVYYEFDWKGRDPDVFIYTEPHGELRVIVKKSGIALDGGDVYQFRSGGFQDMIRTLKRLQSWAESNREGKNAMRYAEADNRFFESVTNGVLAYRAEARQRGAGKLLNVVSVRNLEPNGRVSTDPLVRGYMLDFDWMQKLVPPQRLQMFRNGQGNFEYYLMPTKQKLGEGGPAPITAAEALSQVLGLVAEQKAVMTTQGGEKLRMKVFQDVLDAVNRGDYVKQTPEEAGKPAKKVILPYYEMVKIVKVEAASASGVVYLARPGMQAVAFRFGTAKVPNLTEFNRAVEQGYLVRRPEGLGVSDQERNKDTQAVVSNAPVERVSARLEVGADKEPTRQEYQDRISVMEQKVDAINSVILNPANSLKSYPSYSRVRTYLAYRLASFEPQEKDNTDNMVKEIGQEVWKLLAEMTDKPYQTDTQGELSPDLKTQIINQLKGKKVPQELDANPRYQVPELKDQLAQLPRTTMFLRGYLDGFADLKESTTLSTEEFAKAESNYKEDLTALVKELVKGGKQEKEKQIDYDKRITAALKPRLRMPHEYLKAIKDNETAITQAEQTKKEDALRAAYDAQLNGEVNQMSLDELAKGRRGGMVAEGVKLFETVKSVKREEVFLSRIEGNDRFAQDKAYFNVKAKNGDGVLPMTVHVFREGGEIWVSASDGPSNASPGDRSVRVKAGPQAIDTALVRAVARHNGLTPDVINLPKVA